MKRKSKIRLILVYCIFILVNIVLNRFVKGLGWPLYVDNVGTALGAVLGGYLPGIFVGYVTNIINSTADPTNLFYAGISVLIAVSISFMAERGLYKSFWKALLTIPVLAFIGGCIGSVLTYFLYGSDIGFWAQIWNDFKLDLLDKAITVVIAYAILKLIPKKASVDLAFTDWCQKPLTKSQLKRATQASKKGMSLRNRIIILITCIMFFVALVTTAISFYVYKNFAVDQYKATGRSIAKLAASTVDGDKVEDYLKNGVQANGYGETKERLTQIKDSYGYIEYVYVYKIMEDGCHVVFDLDTEDVAGSPAGTVIEFDESFMELVPTLLKGGSIDPIITDDTYGWLLTDYEPVFNSKGECVCYAGADINMEDIRHNSISFLAKVISLFMGFFILVLVLCMWFSEYHLTFPVNAMTFAAGEFAYNSDDSLETSVERLKELEITTGDEIENLYHVIVKTMSDTVRYAEEVHQKGDQLANMQNGLIYILADLVESRDKCTGDHVRKTAAYVKLILQLLKEDGVYPDVINDDYIKDVCNSAPLHDVGKIKVSDVILNKPARLTDEEYEEMKKHTTEGKTIIESAMALSKDAGYLNEALNLATYHHEKWDGTGYPVGMKGEEIPLSARIMAVSDVFDALVSTRSYKKPFTFEEAMKIIVDGSGTHFDPKIVKVFSENADKVKEIADEHKRTIG